MNKTEFNVLEFFAGSCTLTTVAEEYGAKTFASDWNAMPLFGEYAVDILQCDVNRVPFVPDVIWASPPCTTFSVASIGRHWNKDRTPKSPEAEQGLLFVARTIALINHFLTLNPKLIWFIENPRGMLRTIPIMSEFRRHTITYCQYGETRQKPTDIWTNSEVWIPRPPCKPRSSCHEAAPRGARTGTQGIKNSYRRSKLPAELCHEIILSCIAKLKQDRSSKKAS